MVPIVAEAEAGGVSRVVVVDEVMGLSEIVLDGDEVSVAYALASVDGNVIPFGSFVVVRLVSVLYTELEFDIFVVLLVAYDLVEDVVSAELVFVVSFDAFVSLVYALASVSKVVFA